MAWEIVRNEAIKIQSAGTVFRSRKQEHRYQIEAVDIAGVVVSCLDANKSETVSKKEVERAICYVNAAGGRTGRRTLHYTVTKEEAIVCLHPRLQWDFTGNWIEAAGAEDLESVADGELTETRLAFESTGREGAILLARHRRRERNTGLIRTFKAEYVGTHSGRAPCEGCGMDFQSVYPGLVAPYIEAHHRTPLAEADEELGTLTTYDDLAFLCANCHRSIHLPRKGKFIGLQELRQELAEGKLGSAVVD